LLLRYEAPERSTKKSASERIAVESGIGIPKPPPRWADIDILHPLRPPDKPYRVIFGRQHGYTRRQDGNAIEGSIRIPDHPAGGVPSVTSSK
jgi:hypothetical protein